MFLVLRKVVYLSAFVLMFCVDGTFSYAQDNFTNGGELRASFSSTVKAVAPAVVNIYTESDAQGQQAAPTRPLHPFFDDPFFSQFLGMPMGSPMRQRIEKSLGSGVIVTAEGHVLTNYHVVEGADKVRVIFNDKREMDAEILGVDENMDIAVLKIQNKTGRPLSFVAFGDSDSLEVGDVVLALGNPYGVGQSVSMGIVSALGRSNLGTNRYENYIQTDAAINPGNSGGPLVDSLGKLVGINTAIFSKSGGSQGIAFATPASAVKVILNSIIKTGKVTRPWFGAAGQNVTQKLAEQLNLERPVGVLINEIIEDSPAAKAGIVLGDIILQFDSFYVENETGLNSRIAGSLIGVPYEIVYQHGDKIIKREIVLSGLPERKVEERVTLGGNHPLTGFTFETLSPALSQELGLPLKSTGVVAIGVPEGGRFFGLNLEIGDVIVSVNKEDIRHVADLVKSTSRRPKSWVYEFKRAGQTFKARVSTSR